MVLNINQIYDLYKNKRATKMKKEKLIKKALNVMFERNRPTPGTIEWSVLLFVIDSTKDELDQVLNVLDDEIKEHVGNRNYFMSRKTCSFAKSINNIYQAKYQHSRYDNKSDAEKIAFVYEDLLDFGELESFDFWDSLIFEDKYLEGEMSDNTADKVLKRLYSSVEGVESAEFKTHRSSHYYSVELSVEIPGTPHVFHSYFVYGMISDFHDKIEEAMEGLVDEAIEALNRDSQ